MLLDKFEGAIALNIEDKDFRKFIVTVPFQGSAVNPY